MKTKTIYITEKINFEFMLSLNVYNDTHLIEILKSLLETLRISFEINGYVIKLKGVEILEVQSLVDVINTLQTNYLKQSLI